MQKVIYSRGKTTFIFFVIFYFLSTLVIHSHFLYFSNSSNADYQYHYNLGIKAQKEGSFDTALGHFQTSLKIATKNNNREDICNSLIKLGINKWNISKLDEAAEFFQNTYDLAKKYDIRGAQSVAENCLHIYRLYNEAKELRAQNKYQKSAELFKNAIDIADSIDALELKLKCLRQLGITHLDEGSLSKFHQITKEAFDIAKHLNHRIEEGRCANNIGYYYLKTDNYSDALIYFNQALTIAEESDNKSSMPDMLNNIGIIYKQIGEYEKALNYLNRALEIDNDFGDAYYISLDLNDIGTTYRHKGLASGNDSDFREALNNYNKCLELSKKIDNLKKKAEIEIAVYNNMGSVHSDLYEYSIALDYFDNGYKKAKDLNDIRSMGMLANNMGIVHANMGNYKQSTIYFTAAISFGNKISSGQILWEAYLELARSYVKQNNFDLALNEYIASIQQIETIRSQIDLEELKASYMGTDKRIEAYQELIELFVSLHTENPDRQYDQEAFTYLERGKARAFLDSLEISKINISQTIDFRLQNTETEIMKDISNLYTRLLASTLSNAENEIIQNELQQKENELENLKREIRSKHPAYAELIYPQIVSFREAQKLLKKETVFFEYTIGKEKSYAFVISKKDLQIFELPKREELHLLVKNYIRALSDKDNFDFQIGYKLFQILVSPGLNNKTKKIIFVNDDILHYLPFETLITEPIEKKWLVQDYKIAYSPSISSLSEIIKRKKNAGLKRKMDFLAFGDPDFGLNEEENHDNTHQNSSPQFSRLRYSGTEIERIQAFFDNNRSTTFLRNMASEEQFKSHYLKDYKIIHFATHTEIDDKQPTRSRIVLSLDSDPKEDGLLQTREIYGIELNADLVTLSACSSGLGKFIRGEGIEGINRAFFYAGTSSVLMSLWTVNDQATYQLMERFYSHLINSKSITSALREAKLEMIESEVLSHPFYWAGFVVSGKADHIIFPNKSSKILYIGLFSALVAGVVVLIAKKKRHYQP